MIGFLLVSFLVISLLLWWWLGGDARDRSTRLCNEFGLDPTRYSLLGSDLGGSKDKVFLRVDGIVGVPDAVFLDRSDKSIVIGEAKSRRYARRPTKYERYQVQLYIGAARKKYNKDARGVIRYGCGARVPVTFDNAEYQFLLQQIPRCRAALNRTYTSG
jgi:hypothetical protein